VPFSAFSAAAATQRVSELVCQSRVQLLFRQRAVMDSLAVGTHLLCLTAVTPGKPVRVTAALTVNLGRQKSLRKIGNFSEFSGVFAKICL